MPPPAAHGPSDRSKTGAILVGVAVLLHACVVAIIGLSLLSRSLSLTGICFAGILNLVCLVLGMIGAFLVYADRNGYPNPHPTSAGTGMLVGGLGLGAIIASRIIIGLTIASQTNTSLGTLICYALVETGGVWLVAIGLFVMFKNLATGSALTLLIAGLVLAPILAAVQLGALQTPELYPAPIVGDIVLGIALLNLASRIGTVARSAPGAPFPYGAYPVPFQYGAAFPGTYMPGPPAVPSSTFAHQPPTSSHAAPVTAAPPQPFATRPIPPAPKPGEEMCWRCGGVIIRMAESTRPRCSACGLIL